MSPLSELISSPRLHSLASSRSRFVFTPRTWPLACGAEDLAAKVIGGGTASGLGAEEEQTKLWDFSHADMRARVVRWRDRMWVNRKDDDD